MRVADALNPPEIADGCEAEPRSGQHRRRSREELAGPAGERAKRTNLARTAPAAKARNVPSPYGKNKEAQTMRLNAVERAAARSAARRPDPPRAHDRQALEQPQPQRAVVKTVQVSAWTDSSSRIQRAPAAWQRDQDLGLLARDTNQAMNRRMKLNDALGKLTGK
jgi:hypothetical protein